MDTFENAAYDHLAKPLHASVADELTWFFRQLQPTWHLPSGGGDDSRLRAARKEFRAPRFTALRRRWLAEGDRAIWLAASPVSSDALTRRRASIECVELAYKYDHLFSLGRDCCSRERPARGMKLPG